MATRPALLVLQASPSGPWTSCTGRPSTVALLSASPAHDAESVGTGVGNDESPDDTSEESDEPDDSDDVAKEST